ncbi:MAG: phosphohydrolase [Desulfuromonas sp.]|nr:MAG: phosphohydrolase [Desulfuromonas sp.]
MKRPDLLKKIERLSAIGIDLSVQKDLNQLLETILTGAKELTGADAGTLYLYKEDKFLHFEIVFADSMNLAMGGKSGNPVTMAPVPLYDESGNPNRRNVVSYAALENRVVNIEDAYTNKDYDFSGTRKFDEKSGYRSKSFLSVPMRDHEDKLIGVLQLINPIDAETGEIVSFTAEDEKLVASLGSQAAVALTRKILIDGLENLLQSLVKLVATAIDEKSPYTGGHCKRVPELTMLLAKAVNAETEGCYAGVELNEQELHELEMAAWLHDCGKITTPEYVVDKRTKLETIFDRIHLVDARLDLLALAAEDSPQAPPLSPDELAEIRAFLHQVNSGGEFLSPEKAERIRELAQLPLPGNNDKSATLLTDDEVRNLCISKGTLTDDERDKIQQHIVSTIQMLEALPFPQHLQQVPAIAGAHHERLDGKGYPRGLTAENLSLQARMLALADIFEALTASDRPYRTPVKLSKALTIVGQMSQEGHVDPDLYRLFVERRLYDSYARTYFIDEQIDEVDPKALPGLS